MSLSTKTMIESCLQGVLGRGLMKSINMCSLSFQDEGELQECLQHIVDKYFVKDLPPACLGTSNAQMVA